MFLVHWLEKQCILNYKRIAGKGNKSERLRGKRRREEEIRKMGIFKSYHHLFENINNFMQNAHSEIINFSYTSLG